MNKQVLIIRQYVTCDQQQLAEQMSAEVKYYKNLFRLAFVLPKDMNFMEAIEYGLSNLHVISSLWNKDREKQWKAIYPTNTCLFKLTYRRDLSSCMIRIIWEK